MGALLCLPPRERLIPELIAAGDRVAIVADPADGDLPRLVAAGQDRAARMAIERPQPALGAGAVQDVVIIYQQNGARCRHSAA